MSLGNDDEEMQYSSKYSETVFNGILLNKVRESLLYVIETSAPRWSKRFTTDCGQLVTAECKGDYVLS